jgi:hypothetical protein
MFLGVLLEVSEDLLFLKLFVAVLII